MFNDFPHAANTLRTYGVVFRVHDGIIFSDRRREVPVEIVAAVLTEVYDAACDLADLKRRVDGECDAHDDALNDLRNEWEDKEGEWEDKMSDLRDDLDIAERDLDAARDRIAELEAELEAALEGK